MEINKMQNLAIEAVEKRHAIKGINASAELSIMHLVEEVGELTSQFNNKLLKRKEKNIKNVGEKISDCIIMLMYLAKQENIDLEKELLSKIEEISKK